MDSRVSDKLMTYVINHNNPRICIVVVYVPKLETSSDSFLLKNATP